MLTINYLPFRRPEYHNVLFHFLNRIKKENKHKILFRPITPRTSLWEGVCEKLQGIKYEIIDSSKKSKHFDALSTNIMLPDGKPFQDHPCYQKPEREGYLNKILLALETSSPYSMSLDEDIFFNEYVWDYIIENINLLDDNENLTLSPTLSSGVPSADYFINDYFTEEDKKPLYKAFCSTNFGPQWNGDYSFLNKYTTEASEWNFENFLEAANNYNFYYKGIHPLRTT